MALDVETLLLVVFTLEGLAVTVFATVIALKARWQREQAMTAFQLHPDATEHEFKTLYYAYAAAFVGVLLGLAEPLGYGVVASVGGVLAAASYVFTVYTYGRWAWRM